MTRDHLATVQVRDDLEPPAGGTHANTRCEHQFHNITPPLQVAGVNELAELIVQFVPRDDFLAVNAVWLISCLLSTVDVPFDTSNAEGVSTLADLHVFCDHGHPAGTAVGVVSKAAELFAVCINDLVHEQDLNEDLAVLSSKVVERVALGFVVHPGQSFIEPVKASEANR